MAATAPTREPYHIHAYNLPQRVEGGVKIYGYDDKDTVLLFDHLDGMYANCVAQGDDSKEPEVFHLHAGTPLVEYKDGYMIEEEPETEATDVA